MITNFPLPLRPYSIRHGEPAVALWNFVANEQLALTTDAGDGRDVGGRV